jgi:hypothetical protein
MQGNPTDDRLRCAHCGDVIGAYEPMIVILDGEAHATSRSAEQSRGTGGEHYHQGCYAESSVVFPRRARISATGKGQART